MVDFNLFTGPCSYWWSIPLFLLVLAHMDGRFRVFHWSSLILIVDFAFCTGPGSYWWSVSLFSLVLAHIDGRFRFVHWSLFILMVDFAFFTGPCSYWWSISLFALVLWFYCFLLWSWPLLCRSKFWPRISPKNWTFKNISLQYKTSLSTRRIGAPELRGYFWVLSERMASHCQACIWCVFLLYFDDFGLSSLN